MSGCKKDSSNAKVKNLKIVRGAKQCALPGETFQKKLIIEVQGPQQRGFLGGKVNVYSWKSAKSFLFQLINQI